MRCDHCQYRNLMDCGDGVRVKNNKICDDFKLDFDTLNKKQKRVIQSHLMFEEENYEIQRNF